jgi:hypothetical protein
VGACQVPLRGPRKYERKFSSPIAPFGQAYLQQNKFVTLSFSTKHKRQTIIVIKEKYLILNLTISTEYEE